MRKRRASRRKSELPKGAYRLPQGGIVMPPRVGPPDKRVGRIVVQAVRRDRIDLRALAKALVQCAVEEAERQQAEDDQSEAA